MIKTPTESGPQTFTDISDIAEWTSEGWFILVSEDCCSPPLKGLLESVFNPKQKTYEIPVQDIQGKRYEWKAVERGTTFHCELIKNKKESLYRSPDLESITAIDLANQESLDQLESQQPILIGFKKMKELPAEIQEKFDRIYKALLRKQ